MRLAALAALMICTVLGCRASAAAAPPLPFPISAAKLAQTFVDAGTFSGTILIARNGVPIFSRSYGQANREAGAANAADTVYRIASATKQFTAAAIMRLVEQGRVRLDDPLAKYYAATPPTWSSVTLRNLLDHTSGLLDYTQVSGFLQNGARLDQPPETLIGAIRDKPPETKPGTHFAYNNTDYILLGLVVEAVSGRSYAQFLDAEFFGPLGMSSTRYDDLGDVVARRAAGYVVQDGRVRNAPFLATSAAFAAGGLRSTAPDLLVWDQALHSGKVLKPQSVSQMFTDWGHGYGFGAFVERRAGHRLWSHGGNLPGFATAFEHYPDDDLTVIVLSNLDGSSAERLSKLLALGYFGESASGTSAKGW